MRHATLSGKKEKEEGLRNTKVETRMVGTNKQPLPTTPDV